MPKIAGKHSPPCRPMVIHFTLRQCAKHVFPTKTETLQSIFSIPKEVKTAFGPRPNLWGATSILQVMTKAPSCTQIAAHYTFLAMGDWGREAMIFFIANKTKTEAGRNQKTWGTQSIHHKMNTAW